MDPETSVYDTVVEYIRDQLGNTVVLPIVIFILGLCLGVKFTKSLRSGLVVGVGFVGLGMVINVLLGAIGPATDGLVERFGLTMNTIDVGFGAAAAIALGTTIGSIVIPCVIVLNVVLLLTRITRTFNVDIWNFWHYAFVGAIVYFSTGHNMVAGIFAAMTAAVYSFMVADWTAPRIQKFFNLPGVSIPQGWATTSVPIILGVNWVIDRIPGVRRWNLDLDTLQKRIGPLGEPLFVGAIIGFFLGLLGSLSVADSLKLAITLAAVMYLMPRIIAIFMEGLLPITDGVKGFAKRHLKGRETYVGLDSAILLGNPATIIVGVLLIPITLAMAAIIPWNTTLPLGDLAATAFFVAMAAPLMKGNVFRGLVVGTILMGMVLMLATFFAPQLTEAAAEVSYAVPETAAGAQYITALSGGNWVAYAEYWVTRGGSIAAIIAFVAMLVLAFFVRRIAERREQARAVTAEAADPAPVG